MAGNSFGTFFRATTFGESHGGAVGVVVDGVPPGVAISIEDIQQELDRRRPGQSEVSSSRDETDTVQILSGIFEGRTSGTPIMLLVPNRDARSSAYDEIKDIFRPGHADLTYFKKYGIRDYRGGGRSSGRETVGRVAAGAIAKKILNSRGVDILAYVVRGAGIPCAKFDRSEIERNIVRACDPDAAREIIAGILSARESGDSVGGIVECRINGVIPGLGEPVFDKLDADLAKAMISIGAVKGFELGAGFAAADMCGSENNDQMDADGFRSNHAGGILGGISTGAEIIFRVAFKPTPSISKPQRTIDTEGQELECVTEGRHDPAIFPRAVPVVEAMAAMVIEDHYQRQAALHRDCS